MRLEYQLTFDDYREALSGARPAPQRNTNWAVVLWVFAAALMVLLGVLLFSAHDRRPDPRPSPPLVPRLMAALGPSLLFCGLIVFLTVRQARRGPAKPWEAAPPGSAPRKPTATQNLLGWVAFLTVATLVFVMLNIRTSPTPTRLPAPAPPRSVGMEDLLPGVVPWVAIVGLLVFTARYNTRGRGMQQAWTAQPALQRPHSTQISDDGIVVEEPLARLEYRWDYFAGFKELPDLFLLYLSPYMFFMIPKRAFTEPAQLDRFRGLLLDRVRHGTFLEQTPAFPVIPLASKAEAPEAPAAR